MNRQIDEVEFVIFDTETTGLSSEQGDRIVEIAAVRLKGEERIAVFSTLVNTHTPVSPGAFQVNHITPEMLTTAPEAGEVFPKFLDFIKDSCLCSFNAGFDLGFLNRELELNALPGLGDIVVVDILKMARKMLPGMERYALWFVAERLGIKNQQQHRALSDVELTLDVFNRLRGIFKDKGISDFSNFVNLFGINRGIFNSADNQKLDL